MLLQPLPAVYMETNRPNGTLYLGSTGNLKQRHSQHRGGYGCAFTKRYGLNQLVWFEYAETEDAAHHREVQLKSWHRAWKVWLVLETNSEWADLSQ